MNAVNNPNHWNREIESLPTLAELFDSNNAMHLDVMARMAERLRGEAISAKVILMASPINPKWYDIPEGKTFHQRYLRTLREFANKNGMAFMNISEEAGLKRDDFVDYEGAYRQP